MASGFKKPGGADTLAALLLLLGAFVAFAPLELRMPAYGLDPSWIAVLGEASTRGYHFGTEINYTLGPLSAVYSRYFDDATFGSHLLAAFVLVGALAFLFFAAARLNGRRAAAMFAGVALMLMLDNIDQLYTALPMLTAFVALAPVATPDDRRLRSAATGAGIVASAIATLAKFSVAPLAFAAMLLVDGARALDGSSRRPLLTAGFAASLFVLFSLAASPQGFAAWLSGSLAIASGYTEAMFLPGPAREVGFYLGSVALLAAVVASIELGADDTVSWSNRAARALVLAIYVFLTWKAGFVRQDTHTFISWLGLAMAALAYWVAAPASGLRRRPTVGLALPGMALFAILVAVPLLWSSYSGRSPKVLLSLVPERIGQRLWTLAELVVTPRTRLAEWRGAKEKAWQTVREAQTLPKLAGSVDVIPSIQSSLLAFGLDYKPRFSVQEYTSYAPLLIEGNRASLIEHGPRHLLFQPGSIDGRHPALAEGPLWPEILSYYEPVALERDLLVLDRRQKPLGDLLQPAGAEQAAFDVPIAVDAKGGAVFLEAGLQKTLVGSLLNLVYRPPLVHMRVAYADGSEGIYRIVPAIANAGFVVAPTISTAKDLLLLAAGEVATLPTVRSVTFTTSRLGRLVYRPQFRVARSRIALERLREQSSKPAVAAALASMLAQAPLLTAPASRPEATRAIPDGLLAQAPVDLDMVIPADSDRLEIGYGILDGAWQPVDGTTGVCFSVERAAAGTGESLHSACLQPKSVAADRGRHDIVITGKFQRGEHIRLRTSCHIDCRYGWAYWAYFRSGSGF